MSGLTSREQDYLAAAHDAERDLVMVAGLLFRASWERMVLLATHLEWMPIYECVMPIGEREFDIIALQAALECAQQHDTSNTSSLEDKP